MLSNNASRNAGSFAVIAALLFTFALIGDALLSRRKPKPTPSNGLPVGEQRDTDNRVIEGAILYEETIDGRTFAIQARTIAGNSVDEVNGIWYVVGTISNGVFAPQNNLGTVGSWGGMDIQGMTQSEWYRTYDEAFAQIERMRPDDDPTSPQRPRPSPPNGGLGGLGSLPTGGSPERASEPSNNPFPSGGSSGGVF